MAGAGYKLFNTGDVLTAAQVNTYLMEQTVMVFANAAARTTALSGVVSEGMISYLKDTNAVEVYDGSNWVSSDDPNAIQNTIVDAKGDLIAASAADTPARLAVGNNGETLVADSSQTTGLRYNPPVGSLGNAVVNGGMDVWQRGTSFTFGNSTTTYGADRWRIYSASSTGRTWSRQTISDSTNLPNIQYATRLSRDSGNTATNSIYVVTDFETVNSIPYAGKTVTFSFYARAGANFSASSGNIIFAVITGTGTDENSIVGFTGQLVPINTTQAITTTWTRYAFTATLSSSLKQIGLQIGYVPTGTAGANDWFELTGVQMDVGTYTASTTPTFRRAGGTLAGEFAAACRYYWRFNASSYNYFATGANRSTTVNDSCVRFPVTMRSVPSFNTSAANTFMVYQPNNGTIVTCTSLQNDGASNDSFGLTATVASGLTAGNAANLRANNATAWLEFSSEL